MDLDHTQSSPTNVAYCNGRGWMGSIHMLSLATIFVDGLWITPYQVILGWSMCPAPILLPHLGVTWCMLLVIVKMIFRGLEKNALKDTMLIEGSLVICHYYWHSALSHVLVRCLKHYETPGFVLTLIGVRLRLHSYTIISKDIHHWASVGNYAVMIQGEAKYKKKTTVIITRFIHNIGLVHYWLKDNVLAPFFSIILIIMHKDMRNMISCSTNIAVCWLAAVICLKKGDHRKTVEDITL